MRIHFTGACGISMAQLAALAEKTGHTVTRSDLAMGGHDPKNIDGADLVVYSVAVSADNPELCRARELKIPILTRAEYLAQICGGFQNTVAVAGSHGNAPPV